MRDTAVEPMPLWVHAGCCMRTRKVVGLHPMVSDWSVGSRRSHRGPASLILVVRRCPRGLPSQVHADPDRLPRGVLGGEPLTGGPRLLAHRRLPRPLPHVRLFARVAEGREVGACVSSQLSTHNFAGVLGTGKRSCKTVMAMCDGVGASDKMATAMCDGVGASLVHRVARVVCRRYIVGMCFSKEDFAALDSVEEHSAPSDAARGVGRGTTSSFIASEAERSNYQYMRDANKLPVDDERSNYQFTRNSGGRPGRRRHLRQDGQAELGKEDDGRAGAR